MSNVISCTFYSMDERARDRDGARAANNARERIVIFGGGNEHRNNVRVYIAACSVVVRAVMFPKSECGAMASILSAIRLLSVCIFFTAAAAVASPLLFFPLVYVFQCQISCIGHFFCCGRLPFGNHSIAHAHTHSTQSVSCVCFSYNTIYYKYLRLLFAEKWNLIYVPHFFPLNRYLSRSHGAEHCAGWCYTYTYTPRESQRHGCVYMLWRIVCRCTILLLWWFFRACSHRVQTAHQPVYASRVCMPSMRRKKAVLNIREHNTAKLYRIYYKRKKNV